MKKISLLVMVLILILTACSAKGLETYEKAYRKTDTVTEGKELLNIDVDMEFNTEGLDADQIRDLSYLDKIALELRFQYAYEENKIKTDIYYNFGGIGLDFLYFMDGPKQYLEIPVIEKYLDISNMGKKYENDEETKIFTDTFKPIKEKWMAILNEKDVVTGENTIIMTEEGEVKATIVTINVDDQQLKDISRVAIESVLNEEFIAQFNQVKLSDEDIAEAKDNIWELMNKVEFDSFKGMVYIDFDGYIIKEEYNLGMKFSDAEPGEPTNMTISITSNLWDIGKDQEFEFPEIKEEDILELEEINEAETFLPGFDIN